MRHRNLASERVRVGMSQTELAAALGMSLKSISQFETNARAMPQELVIKAADLFGCSTDYLYDRTDDRLPHGNALAN